MAAAIAIATGVIGFAWSNLSTQVSELQAVNSSRGERIRALEIQAENIQRTLDRIEVKLELAISVSSKSFGGRGNSTQGR